MPKTILPSLPQASSTSYCWKRHTTAFNESLQIELLNTETAVMNDLKLDELLEFFVLCGISERFAG